jgi:hypothetical protein
MKCSLGVAVMAGLLLKVVGTGTTQREHQFTLSTVREDGVVWGTRRKHRTFHQTKVVTDRFKVLSNNLGMANWILVVFVTPKNCLIKKVNEQARLS